MIVVANLDQDDPIGFLFNYYTKNASEFMMSEKSNSD